MENPVNFELRYAAHQQQVSRINAEDWQYQASATTPGRLRTTLARTLVALAARLAPATRPVSEVAASPALY